MRKTKTPLTVVASLLCEGKAYCRREHLAALAALEAPEEERVAYVFGLDGVPNPTAEELPTDREALSGPVGAVYDPPHYAYHVGRLREQLRQVILDRCRPAWVLWVDADVLPAPDTLRRLRAAGEPLVSGLLLSRTSYRPLLGDPNRRVGAEGLQDLGPTGMGCLLTRGDLCQAVGWEDYLAAGPGTGIGEDIHFCLSAGARAGRPVLTDPAVTPWHLHANGLGVRAAFEAGRLVPEIRPLLHRPEHWSGRVALISTISGRNPRFGRLRAGELVTADREGPLSDETCEALARESQFLFLIRFEEANDGIHPAL